MLLHSFYSLPKGDVALQQRNKRGFQLFAFFFYPATAGNKSPCVPLYINKPKETAFCYGNATSEERDPYYSHCQPCL